MNYLTECLLYAGVILGFEPDSLLALEQNAEPKLSAGLYSEPNFPLTTTYKSSLTSPPLSHILPWTWF